MTNNLTITVMAILFFQQAANAQLHSSIQPVSVSLYIVGEGESDRSRLGGQNYLAMVSVTNNQDTTTRFWIMTCDWSTDNFKFNNDSVRFNTYGCDSNFPVMIELEPGKSIHFSGPLTTREKLVNKKLRVGFVYVQDGRGVFGYTGSLEKLRDCPVYWSNEEILEHFVFKYRQD